MSPASRGNWRGRLIEHVATVVKHAYPERPHALTVQQLLDQPAARGLAIADALRRANPATSGTGTVDEYHRVQNAADALRGYEGERI